MLTCKECGGELTFSNTEYICKNCGCKISLNELWENIDVCILNNENADRGSRTLASYLSEEIYNNLKSRKINTYFVRVSALDLFGEHIERSRISAINGAKIVIIVGTDNNEFCDIADKYNSLLKNKTVIPVFKEMSANLLPKNISEIQGIDYEKIGAREDLVKGVLNILGRSEEYDFLTVSNQNSKKKKVIIASVVALTLILLCVAAFLIINKFKNANSNLQLEMSIEEKYSSAMQLFSEEKYADALTLFLENPDYKNSQNQINLIYQKYVGFYRDEEHNINLHFQVWDGSAANVELKHFSDSGEICRINENFQMKGEPVALEFTDSENNKGTLKICFVNSSIDIELKTLETRSEISFGDLVKSFDLKNKSNSSLQNVTKEQLEEFIKNRYTIKDLTRMGIETEYYDNKSHAPPVITYKIKNTNFIVCVDDQNRIYDVW